MKILIAILIALPSAFPMAASAEPRSFSLVLHGLNGQPINENVDRALRKMLGTFFENMAVKKYVLRAIPAGGGFDVCIEPVEPQGFNFIIGELNTIGVNPSIAYWGPELVETCDEPAPPTQEAK